MTRREPRCARRDTAPSPENRSGTAALRYGANCIEASPFGAAPPAVASGAGAVFRCRGRTLARLTENVKSRVDEATQDQVVLGRALRQLRDQTGLRQDELGARLGIDATYISQVENGRRGVRWHTVARFLRALGANLHQLADTIAEIEKQDPQPKH
jgi:DNA-binding XRE family transcriptional regulator